METQINHNEVLLSQVARQTATDSYLDTVYTPQRRPYTDYPLRLCQYLTQTYFKEGSCCKLLDLCCGRGDFLHAFAQCGFDAQGINNCLFPDSPFKEPITVSDCDGKPFPFENSFFDVIFSKSAIEHIHDTDVFLRESFRVLRPGGLCITMTPDWRSQHEHFYDDYTHIRPFTLAGLVDAIRGHHFIIRDARRFRQLPLVWKYPLLHLLCDALSLLPTALKRYKIVQFSKEWMLLVVAQKPEKGGTNNESQKFIETRF